MLSKSLKSVPAVSQLARWSGRSTRMMSAVARPSVQGKFENWIGGKWVAPVGGEYFDNVSPIDGKLLTQNARSGAPDIDLAVEAATTAFATFKDTPAAERSAMLNKIADKIEEHLGHLAAVETLDNGKAVRETMAADLPLVIDHFRYFAGVIRAEEGSIAELDKDTVSICLHEPLGVVGQVIPWNFPLLMAAWKLAPALAAGCCVVIKPAEQTPVSIMVLMDLIKDIVPPGVVNVVTGFGAEAGSALAVHKGIHKLAFTGSGETGKFILKATAENLIPTTMELGGKSPLIFFKSVGDEDDEFFDKAIESAVMFALNQGEVCTCPSRVLVHEDIADRFVEKMVARTEAIKLGDPMDTDTMMGAQASQEQQDKITKYLDIGKAEGAQVLTGGKAHSPIQGGYYIQPTIFRGTNNMRVFQEEIFGPVVGVTTFKTEEEAIKIANDTTFGLGAGVFTRDAHQAYQVPRAIQAGRVWVNCYHLYPAHAPFGGYKQSGFGRETHKMMLAHYRQTKNILTSYNKNKLGFF